MLHLKEGATLGSHHTLNAAGYDFAYIEKGSGEPVVFVHGSLLDFRYWQTEVDALSDRFRAIAYSRRYHWPNAKPDGPFSYTGAGHTDDLIAFLEALGAGPAHLLGHSYGGYMAARLATLRPDLLLSLALVEPGGPIEGEVSGRSRIEEHNRAADLVRQGHAEEGVAYFMDTVCFDPRWKDGPEIYRQATVENAFTITEQVKEIRPTISAEGLSAIPCPTLLMMGARSGSPFTETLNRLEELVPDARRIVVAGASHLVNQDNPAGFTEALVEFLVSIRSA